MVGLPAVVIRTYGIGKKAWKYYKSLTPAQKKTLHAAMATTLSATQKKWGKTKKTNPGKPGKKRTMTKAKIRYRNPPKKKRSTTRKAESAGDLFIGGTLVNVGSRVLPILRSPLAKGIAGEVTRKKAGWTGKFGKAAMVIAGYEFGGQIAGQLMQGLGSGFGGLFGGGETQGGGGGESQV